MKGRIEKTDAEWKRTLRPEQYRVLREKGTEMPFTGKYWNHNKKGVYRCAACGQEVFSSEAKFDAGCGWPSFSKPLQGTDVKELSDSSHGMIRTEVLCSRCQSHLGHVFNDGPAPTGLRYCINSAALDFSPAGTATNGVASETATFAAGCFWGVEAAFREVDGVLDTTVGYTGGRIKDPTYRQVCTDRTGHAEAVQVTYDPAKVSYEKLLDVFWGMHAPTQLNRQGPDVGTQYRSAIFYHDETQRAAALKSKEALEKSHRFRRPVVTAIEPATPFYRAEEYHQRYLEKNGGAHCTMRAASGG